MTLTWTPPSLPRQKTAIHENTAVYATAIHEGARLRNGGSIQARPWMLSAYQGPYGDFDAIEEFTRTYRLSGSLATAFQSTAIGANNTMKGLIRFRGWPYDASTLRKNRQLIGPGTRDILDLGGLLKNQQPVRFI